MSETTAPSAPLLTTWGTELAAASCARCHGSFLIPCERPGEPPGARSPLVCPNCGQGALEVLPGGLSELAHPALPELVVPFSLSEPKLVESIRNFAASIPFAPPELTPAALLSRLAVVYLPMWLVDSSVSATWQAEAGFDYQVLSHQEFFEQNGGGWKSREVQEPRVRWEARLGRLERAYQNVTAPALDDAPRLEKRLGRYRLDTALSYTPDIFRQDNYPRLHPKAIYARMPDQPPKGAWGEAAVAFQKTAAEECQRACAADHLRQFRWNARFDRLNWTLMLLPVYATWYHSDHGESHSVLFNGQMGTAAGERRASVRRAARASLYILLAGLLLFLAGLLFNARASLDPLMSEISTWAVVLGAAGLLASPIPPVIAWDFNRRQRLAEVEIRN